MDYEGLSSKKGIEFSGEYVSVFTYRNSKGKIKYDIDELEDVDIFGVSDFMYKIPCIRAIWDAVEDEDSKMKTVFKLIVLLLPVLVFSNKIGTFDFNMGYVAYLIIIMLPFILGFFSMRSTSTGQYHAAEHMVCNAFDQDLPLTMENVQKQKRTHYFCGTNETSFRIIIFILLSVCVYIFNFPLQAPIIFIASLMIAYELSYIEKGVLKVVFKPLFMFGRFMQYYIFTNTPEKEHVEIAIASFKKFYELEIKAENKVKKRAKRKKKYKK
ncbi:DUF1385 domain-containing protein [Ectobacillus sp. sgz5001026]|uniref:DUF1385 domain-containing protein n=1 Tax=Ectobacillus sp. sgz5001026 TaxID=3242473 RepID=UPI0036D299D5